MTSGIDTNILARALLNDDPMQSRRAQMLLDEATELSISTVVFAELVWVLRTKKVPQQSIVIMLETLMTTGKVRTDIVRFQAGLAFMKRGGDFADGVALHDAARASALPVRTFDKDFARLGAPDVVLIS